MKASKVSLALVATFLVVLALTTSAYAQNAVPVCKCMYPETEIYICGLCNENVCQNVGSTRNISCVIWQLQTVYCCQGKWSYKSYINTTQECAVAEKRELLPKEKIFDAERILPSPKPSPTQISAKRGGSR